MLQKILSTIIILVIASSFPTTYAGSVGISLKERKRVEDLMHGMNEKSIQYILKHNIQAESGTGTGRIDSFNIAMSATEDEHMNFTLDKTLYELKYDASTGSGHISLKGEARLSIHMKDPVTNIEESTGTTFDFDLDIFSAREDLRVRLNALNFKRGILGENSTLGKHIEDSASEVLGTTYKIGKNPLIKYTESMEQGIRIYSTRIFKATQKIEDGVYKIQPTQALAKLAQDFISENKFFEPMDPQKGYKFQGKFIENQTGTARIEYDFTRSKRSFFRGFDETTPTTYRSEGQIRINGDTRSSKTTEENNIFTLSQISTTPSYITEIQITTSPEVLSTFSIRKSKSKRKNPGTQTTDSYMMSYHIKEKKFLLELSEGSQKDLIKVSHAPREDSLFETDISMKLHPPGQPDITIGAKIVHYTFQKEKVEINIPPVDIALNIIPGALK